MEPIWQYSMEKNAKLLQAIKRKLKTSILIIREITFAVTSLEHEVNSEPIGSHLIALTLL